jgi:hypothetical protein
MIRGKRSDFDTVNQAFRNNLFGDKFKNACP